MRFTTTVQVMGKTATGIEVPEDVVAALGQGKKPRVHVRIGGHTYRSTVAVMGGRFLLPLAAEHRTAAGVAGGDEVEVELTLDTEAREVNVPDDLAAALDAAGARPAFDALNNSTRRGHITDVEGAKAPETRQRRIAKIVATLS
ncbi:MAG: hypothetical protein JWN67_4515 [Actinomycetia bacterium]|nr:hypothetical protein [Actinomycetes bacterium]